MNCLDKLITIGVSLIISCHSLCLGQSESKIEGLLGDRVSCMRNAEIISVYMLKPASEKNSVNAFYGHSIVDSVSILAENSKALTKWLLNVNIYDVDSENNLCTFSAAYGLEYTNKDTGDPIYVLISNNCRSIYFPEFQNSNELLKGIQNYYPKVEENIIALFDSIKKLKEMPLPDESEPLEDSSTSDPVDSKLVDSLGKLDVDKRIIKLLSRTRVNGIQEAKEAGIYFLESRKSYQSENSFDSYPIKEESLKIEEKTLEQLKELLLSPRLYLLNDEDKSCVFSPNIGIALGQGAEQIRMLVSLNCDLIVFQELPDSPRVIEDIDPGREILLEYLKSVFSKKSKIHNIE